MKHTAFPKRFPWIGHGLRVGAAAVALTGAVVAVPTPVHAQEVEPASASRLASVALPSGAIRIADRSMPEQITKALRTMMDAAGPKVKQGRTEMLAWTRDDFKKLGIENLKAQIGDRLKSEGWTYEESAAGDEKGLMLVSVIRTKPTRRGLIGFWAQTDEMLALAWTEMIPVAESPDPAPPEGERSIKGILDSLKGPHIPTPPPPEEYRVKPETATPARSAATPTAAPANAIQITLAPQQTVVNVMKSAMPPLPTFPPLAPKKGMVRGYVRDSKGKPVKGAVIGVRSTVAGGFYSGASGKSDEKGYYEITVPWGAAHFYTASAAVDYGEGRAAMGLHPSDGEVDSFASANGLVENWVLLPYGIGDRDGVQDQPHYSGNYYGGSFTLDYNVADSRFPDDYSLPDGAEIEVTLTPDGPLVDGSAGRPIVIRRAVREDAPKLCYINNIPVGVYRVSARLLQNGGSAPLLLKETGPYSSQSFGLEPKEARGTAMLSFRPGSAKAGSGAAGHGNWGSLSITLRK
jgi:hypothetical protein